MRHGVGKPEIIFHLLFGAAAEKKNAFFLFLFLESKNDAFVPMQVKFEFHGSENTCFSLLWLCTNIWSRFVWHYEKSILQKKNQVQPNKNAQPKKTQQKWVFFLGLV